MTRGDDSNYHQTLGDCICLYLKTIFFRNHARCNGEIPTALLKNFLCTNKGIPNRKTGGVDQPTMQMITQGDVEDFCKTMKDLTDIFDEIKGQFKKFIIDLIKMVPSISSIKL
jgi:hypothetical protein